jgi:hypothetical protein
LVGVVAGLMAVGSGAALAADGLSIFGVGDTEGAALAGLVQTRIDDRIRVVNEHGGAIRVSRAYALLWSV